MRLTYCITQEDSGRKVEAILKYRLNLSNRFIKKLKYANRILCNSSPVHVNHVVKNGDVIDVLIDMQEEETDVAPENIPISVIYEDDSLIAVNKQAGIVVHPTSSHQSGTIANALAYHFKNKGEKRKIRPVSRLDRDTSGIIIFAKNQFVQEQLIQQMASKTFTKEYIGVVSGTVANKAGTIDLPIERKPGSIMERHISPSGAKAVTHYEVIEYLNDATCLRFFLETGRTHQIRVHCQAVGHPLIGDTLYSNRPSDLISRQALHSSRVSFIHPLTQKRIMLTAPLPQDIKDLMEILRK